jgi:hypothetical protein
MLAFSHAHMSLLAPTTDDAFDLQRWWRIAWAPLKALISRCAWRRGIHRDDQDDLVQQVAGRLHERILEGTLAGLEGDVERSIGGLVDNVVHAAARRDRRERQRRRDLARRKDLEPTSGTAPETPGRGEVIHAHRLAALRIRELVEHPVQRLLLILVSAPGGFMMADLERAGTGSKALGCRLDELQERLPVWRERAVDYRMRNPGAVRTATLRVELAWILRGEPSSAYLKPRPAELRRAVNWLDQNLKRARRARDAELEARQPR